MPIDPPFPPNRSEFNPDRRGFTLVELLIVVTIVGVLASVVVNLFSSAAGDARASSLRMNLTGLRSQVMIYYQEHGNTYPTLANFVNQLILATDAGGNTAAVGTPGYEFGPYLRNIPNNPNTNTATIGTGSVGTSAWYYNETTGEFRANDSVVTSVY